MGGRPRFTYEFVKSVFEARGCKLLETEYHSDRDQLRYIAQCGHERTSNFNNFYRGKGDLCRACRYKGIGAKQRLGVDKIRAAFESEGMMVLEILGDKAKSPVRYIASCGHENTTDYEHFVQQNSGRVCNKCSKSIRYDYEYVRDCFAAAGCELLETEYVNCKTSMRFRARCGHISRIDFDHFLNLKDYSKLCYACAGEAVKRGELKAQRQGLEMREWRDAVYARDNYTCQLCGIRGGKLNAHHLYSYKGYPQLAYDLSNGVTLCAACHRAFHTFQTGVTTPEMFREFKSIVDLVSGNTEVSAGSNKPTTP